MKIFIKSSLVKDNAVGHLTLAVLPLLNCNQTLIYVVVVVLVLETVFQSIWKKRNKRAIVALNHSPE